MDRRFAQVDVFGTSAAAGNPVAVVLDGTGLEVAWMQQLAAWLNVAETAFVLPAEDPDADYRVRIFTVAEELPFAGHPTLGTCHAWLAAGNRPRREDTIVQECGAGLIRVRRTHAGFAFASPPLRRSGLVDDQTRAAVSAALGVGRGEVLAMEWVDNGPGWLGVLLDSTDRLRALDCGPIDQFIGVAAARDDGDLEVRAFHPVRGKMVEDPVCGSLNAALARWLPKVGAVRFPYGVYQGAAVGRSGRAGTLIANHSRAEARPRDCLATVPEPGYVLGFAAGRRGCHGVTRRSSPAIGLYAGVSTSAGAL